jgi:hypothetical protein
LGNIFTFGLPNGGVDELVFSVALRVFQFEFREDDLQSRHKRGLKCYKEITIEMQLLIIQWPVKGRESPVSLSEYGQDERQNLKNLS